MKKLIVIFGVILLATQLFLSPLSMLYAENDETEDYVEAPLTEESYLEVEEEGDAHLIFDNPYIEGLEDDQVDVTFFADREIKEVIVLVPNEAKLVEAQLQSGVSVKKNEESNEWLIIAEREQSTFVLPIVFESEGHYEISIGDVTAIIDISKQEVIETDESSDSDSDHIDDVVNSFEESEESIEQEKLEEKQDSLDGENEKEQKFSFKGNDTLITQIDKEEEIHFNTEEKTDSFRVVLPEGADINNKDDYHAVTFVEEYSDNSKAYLLTTEMELTEFQVNISFSKGGQQQLVIEDRDGEIDAAFLFIFVENGTSRNTLSSDQLRSTVSVSSQAQFRNGWNNESATILEITSLISVSSSNVNNLQTRTRNLTVRTIDRFNYAYPANVNSASVLPMNSNVTLTISGGTPLQGSFTAPLRGFSFRGGNIELLHSGTISSAGLNEGDRPHATMINNLTVWNYGSIVLTSSNRSFIVTGSTTLSTHFYLDFGTGNVFSTTELNINTHAFFTVNTRGEHRAWADLIATVRNGEVVNSNHPSFTTETFGNPSNYRILASYSDSGVTPEPPTQQGSVVVSYRDQSGRDLAAPETLTGAVGSPYNTSAKEINGYRVINNPANAQGVFTQTPISVTYIYEEIGNPEPTEDAVLIINYREKGSGNEVRNAEVANGKVGQAIRIDTSVEGYNLVDWSARDVTGNTNVGDWNSITNEFTPLTGVVFLDLYYEEGGPGIVDPVGVSVTNVRYIDVVEWQQFF